MSGIKLLVDAAHGVYVPQVFAGVIDRDIVHGVEPEDWAVLEAGPEHELYWDTWAGVLDYAQLTPDDDGSVWRLFQDGDVWAYCVDLMTPMERENWAEELGL